MLNIDMLYIHFILGERPMKVAIIGSRSLIIQNIESYLPSNITEIISGGARGVDASAKEYALAHGITITEFLPDYRRYGRSAR